MIRRVNLYTTLYVTSVRNYYGWTKKIHLHFKLYFCIHNHRNEEILEWSFIKLFAKKLEG